MVSLTWLFILLNHTIMCHLLCTIKLTHSCCTVAFFYRGVSYYFPTSVEGTGKKLNRPAKLSTK